MNEEKTEELQMILARITGGENKVEYWRVSNNEYPIFLLIKDIN